MKTISLENALAARAKDTHLVFIIRKESFLTLKWECGYFRFVPHPEGVSFVESDTAREAVEIAHAAGHQVFVIERKTNKVSQIDMLGTPVAAPPAPPAPQRAIHVPLGPNRTRDGREAVVLEIRDLELPYPVVLACKAYNDSWSIERRSITGKYRDQPHADLVGHIPEPREQIIDGVLYREVIEA